MESHAKSPGPGNSASERGPRVRKIGSLVSQLMSRRGYAQVLANEDLHRTIAEAVGEPLAASFQVGNLRQGVLQLFVADSVSLQELNFQKRSILKKIQHQMPDSKVTDIRFRIQ